MLKKYYIIKEKIGDCLYRDFTIVESEEVARDYCNKYPNYCYFSSEYFSLEVEDVSNI